MTRRSAQRVRRLLLIPLGFGLGFALSACAVGNAKYGCPGLPDKPLCLPPSSIYVLSEGQGSPLAARRRPSLQGPCDAQYNALHLFDENRRVSAIQHRDGVRRVALSPAREIRAFHASRFSVTAPESFIPGWSA